MKKLYFTISILIFGVSNAQLYTPNGNINGTTTNSETGNIGVGTNTPTEKLEINGSIKANTYFKSSSGNIIFADSNGIAFRGLKFPAWSDGVSTRFFQIGEVNDNTILTSLSGNRFNRFMILSSITQFSSGGYNSNIPTGIFEVSNGTKGLLNILETGNVGIDVINPNEKLEINGNLKLKYGYSIIGNSNDLFNVIKIRRSDETQLGALSYDGWGNFTFNNKLAIGSVSSMSNSSASLYVNGSVGIGTLNPQVKLEVKSLQNNTIAPANGVAKFVGNDAGIFVGTLAGTPNYGSWLQSMRETDALPFQMLINPLGGDVGIGTSTPSAKLDVAGTSSFSGNMKVTAKLEAKEIKVTTTPTADFVFATDYDLPKLEEVEKHIKEKKHLPEIASAKQMEKEGVNIGEFQIKLLQKIEELTLYSIEQNKRIKELEFQNKEMLELKKQIQILTNKNKK